MYDVVPISEVEPRTKFLSLRIANHISPDEIKRTEVLEEARSWQMPLDAAEAVLDECLERLEKGGAHRIGSISCRRTEARNACSGQNRKACRLASSPTKR